MSDLDRMMDFVVMGVYRMEVSVSILKFWGVVSYESIRS